MQKKFIETKSFFEKTGRFLKIENVQMYAMPTVTIGLNADSRTWEIARKGSYLYGKAETYFALSCNGDVLKTLYNFDCTMGNKPCDLYVRNWEMTAKRFPKYKSKDFRPCGISKREFCNGTYAYWYIRLANDKIGYMYRRTIDIIGANRRNVGNTFYGETMGDMNKLYPVLEGTEYGENVAEYLYTEKLWNLKNRIARELSITTREGEVKLEKTEYLPWEGFDKNRRDNETAIVKDFGEVYQTFGIITD